MSEDKTTAVEETVSEAPAKETNQDSSNDGLIAESKKYRKRAQDAESALLEYQNKFKKQEEDKLKEKEEYKTLFEKASSELKDMSVKYNDAQKNVEKRRESLLKKHPEEERESLSKLDLDTLEYVTGKIQTAKANAPEVVGNSRKDFNTPPKDWTKLSPSELRESWGDIVKDAAQKSKANAKNS